MRRKVISSPRTVPPIVALIAVYDFSFVPLTRNRALIVHKITNTPHIQRRFMPDCTDISNAQDKMINVILRLMLVYNPCLSPPRISTKKKNQAIITVYLSRFTPEIEPFNFPSSDFSLSKEINTSLPFL